jgi:hypothetical protein
MGGLDKKKRAPAGALFFLSLLEAVAGAELNGSYSGDRADNLIGAIKSLCSGLISSLSHREPVLGIIKAEINTGEAKNIQKVNIESEAAQPAKRKFFLYSHIQLVPGRITARFGQRLEEYAIIILIGIICHAPGSRRIDRAARYPGRSAIELVIGTEINSPGKLSCAHKLNLEGTIDIKPSVIIDEGIGVIAEARPAPGIIIKAVDVAIGLAVNDRTAHLPAFRHALIEEEFYGPVFTIKFRDIVEAIEEWWG